MKSILRRQVWRWTGAGVMAMLLLSGCGGGSGGAADANTAPQASILLAGQVAGGAAGADVSGSVGGEIVMSGAGSTDSDGNAMTYAWSIVSKPAASTLQLPADGKAELTVKADQMGTYVFNLRVSDSKGAYSDKRATVLIDNAAPVSALVVKASYTSAAAVKPSQVVTVGASVVLDATGSTDADGDTVNTSWTLMDKPAGSAAALVINGQTARFTADLFGVYRVKARGADARGAYSETVYVFDASNRAPDAVVLGSVVPGPAQNAGQGTVTASVGYLVSLSQSAANVAAQQPLTYSWTFTDKPAGSAAVLSTPAAPQAQFAPDLLGDYKVRLTVTDALGGASYYTTTVAVRNRRPLATIGSNATPTALPAGPTLRVPPGTELTLRGGGSSDADGDAISYAWSIASKPAGSATALSAASTANVKLTPDLGGSYLVRLRVSDPSGAYSERTLTLEVGNYLPTAVLDKTRMTLLAGATATVSAALSFDEDGDALTYAWALDARPAGSSAAVASPSQAVQSFVPDVAGTYVLSVSVSDGRNTNVAYVNIRALAQVPSTLTLPFVPLEARYSKGLDQLVVVASNPNALKIINPFTGLIKSVVLPLPVKSLQLSADGKLAAVLHEGVLSLVDIDTAQIIRSSATGTSSTDAFVTNAGMAYLIGQTGGQWVSPGVTIMNARTGQMAAQQGPNWSFYGTQRGIFAASKNKVFLLSDGLSPADVSFFTIDSAGTGVVSTGDSPYHGDYSMGTPFFLSGSEDLLFTSSGNYFRTDTLQYAGRLAMAGGLLSMSYAGNADEAIALQAGVSGTGVLTYKSAYQRFAGALLLPDSDIQLPYIGGQQSYGIHLFHSAAGNHIALVQTGSDEKNGAGLRYYVVFR